MNNEKNKSFYEKLDDEIGNMLKDALEADPSQIEKKNEYAKLLDEYYKIHDALFEDEQNKIVPITFRISDLIDAKIEILKECIENKSLIIDALSYSKIEEGYMPLVK